jgi:TolA-binding protein
MPRFFLIFFLAVGCVFLSNAFSDYVKQKNQTKAHIESLQDGIQSLQRSIERMQKELDQLKKEALEPDTNTNKDPFDTPNAPPQTDELPADEPPLPEQENSPPGWNQGPLPGGKNRYLNTLPPKHLSSTPKPKSSAKSTSKATESSKDANTNNLYAQGRKLLRQGKVNQARELFHKVKENHPDYPRAIYWLGMIAMFQDKNFKAASPLFSQVYQYCDKKKGYDELLILSLLKLAESLFYENKRDASKVVLEECQEKAKKTNISQEIQKEINALMARIK